MSTKIQLEDFSKKIYNLLKGRLWMSTYYNLIFVIVLHISLIISYVIYQKEPLIKYRKRKFILFVVLLVVVILFWLPILIYQLQ